MRCILKFKGIDRHIEDMLENSYIFLQNPKNFNDIFDSKSVQDSYNVITIFCGAGIEEIGNTKLWGVYGDCGKGIVLKYKISNSKIGYMHKVLYGISDEIAKGQGMTDEMQKDYTELTLSLMKECKNPFYKDDYFGSLIGCFLKSKNWEAENEIRYIIPGKLEIEGDYNVPMGITPNDFKAKTREDGWEIEEIYLGSKYLNNDLEKLKILKEVVVICKQKNIDIYIMEEKKGKVYTEPEFSIIPKKIDHEEIITLIDSKVVKNEVI